MHGDQTLPGSWPSEPLTRKVDASTPQNEPFAADPNASLT